MKIYNIFQKNPETFTESGSYDVAGNPADLRQMITLLQVPQRLELPQRPSLSYDGLPS